MPIFELCATVTVTAYTKVEAKTFDDAVKKVERRGVELSTGGDGYGSCDFWLIQEADGLPCNIEKA